ncbi:DUF6088 family protein [Brotaphodocola sp.]|uniref:DUF6088 family protein n=1 Tax=Brotaphodocola sp. TaxID=3073577 RepID=UPI003D7EA78A
MLYEYLTENYKPNEPILLSDIDIPYTNGQLDKLCEDDKVKRFDKGVYYLPKKTRLPGGTLPSAESVAVKKYIKNKGQINGYYSGFTFANWFGITTQVPFKLEIVTNNTDSERSSTYIRNIEFVLKKPRVPVTNDNYKVLQLLDLLSEIYTYSEGGLKSAAPRVRKYIKDENIKCADVEKYLNAYPKELYKNMEDMKCFEELRI